MNIRNIKEEDYIQYKSLMKSDISEDKYISFLKNILNENHQIIIIEDNNNLIATGTIFIEPKMTYGGCLMGHIENIFVNDNYRRKGIGIKVVEKLLKIAKNKGCYRVDLTCINDLEKFYKKNNLEQRNQISMSILFEENFN